MLNKIIATTLLLIASNSYSAPPPKVNLYKFIQSKGFDVPDYAKKVVIAKDIEKLETDEKIDFIQALEEETSRQGVQIKGLEHSLRLGREGNGGDNEALKIQELAHDMVNQIKVQQNLYFKNNERYDVIDTDELTKLVDATAVFLVDYKLCSKANDTKCPKERGFVLKNYPSTLEIHINYDRWMKLNQKERIRILAHEYFGLIGVEKGVYNLSNELVTNATEVAEHEYVSCMISLLETADTTWKTVHTGHVSVGIGSASSRFVTLKPFHSLHNLKTPKFLAAVVLSAGSFRLKVVESEKVNDNLFFAKKNGKVYMPETVIVSDDFNTTKQYETEDVKVTVTCHGI